MRIAPRAFALAAALLALQPFRLAADRFDDSLAAAKAKLLTAEGRDYAARIAERFDEKKLRDALLACVESAKEEDSAPFIVLLELGGDGRPSQVLLRPPLPVAVCLRWAVRETAFPRPPSPGYWVMVDVSPTRAPGAPPIPTPGVATATVPPTPTPAAPAPGAPPPPVPTPPAMATPAGAVPIPTPAHPSLAATPPVPPVIDLAVIAAGAFHVDARRQDIGELRRRLEESRAEVVGPLLAQADGVAPDDPRLEPYWSLAEGLDLPVALPLGPEPPGAAPSPRYRAALGDPLRLESALLRHPKLRVVVSRAGWPMGDAMVALMWRYPQVFVDTSVIAWSLPRAEFHAYLRRFVEAGLADRILFGSGAPDAEAGARAVEAVQSAEFLTAAEKRDILYGNAARFLRRAPGEPAARR